MHRIGHKNYYHDDLENCSKCCRTIFRLNRNFFHTCRTYVDVSYNALKLYSCYRYVREIPLIDVVCVSTLKVANKVAQLIIKRQVFKKDDLKTKGQKKREREIILLKKELGADSIYPKFCQMTARYVNMTIPKHFGELLDIVPLLIEGRLFYQMGLVSRYISYKLDQHTNYREIFCTSETGKMLSAKYTGFRTKFVHSLFNANTLSPLVNFEHLFLQICSKIKKKSDPNRSQKIQRIVMCAIRKSLAHMEQADKYVDQLKLTSDEDAYIARLQWYKTHQVLPKGVPDPSKESLTPSNLKQKCHESMHRYLDGIATKLVDRIKPNSFKSGILRAFYFLEGKDALKRLLCILMGDLGINQIADPHQFALAILYTRGIEVTDYELDGFGRGKKRQIIKTGRQMLYKAASAKNSWKSVTDVFHQSGLRHNPQSFEGIMQKKEAKIRLRECIADLIYDAIKDENYRQPSGQLKHLREKASQIPILGTATLSLHFLFNGMFFSLGYLFRDTKEGETTFLSWMFKSFSGKNLCYFLADRIIELIYHPNWRISLMYVIECFCNKISDNTPPTHIQLSKQYEDFKTIARFLFDHFTQDLSQPVEFNIRKVFKYITSKENFRLLLKHFNTPGKPILDQTLEAVLPSIKELLLYSKVIESFRMNCVSFEGDAKFWEYFIRESLNIRVEYHANQHRSSSNKPSLAELATIRGKIVDKLLLYNECKLRNFLYDLPKTTSKKCYYERNEMSVRMFPHETEKPQETIENRIVWDYVKE